MTFMQETSVYMPGDIVRVTYGSRGAQKAEIVQSLKTDKWGHKYYKARKFSKKSGKWTKAVKVYACAIIE